MFFMFEPEAIDLGAVTGRDEGLYMVVAHITHHFRKLVLCE